MLQNNYRNSQPYWCT